MLILALTIAIPAVAAVLFVLARAFVKAPLATLGTVVLLAALAIAQRVWPGILSGRRLVLLLPAAKLLLLPVVIVSGWRARRTARRRIATRDAPPGEGWQPTAERFVDAVSRETIAVWYEPASGRRAYVRVG